MKIRVNEAHGSSQYKIQFGVIDDYGDVGEGETEIVRATNWAEAMAKAYASLYDSTEAEGAEELVCAVEYTHVPAGSLDGLAGSKLYAAIAEKVDGTKFAQGALGINLDAEPDSSHIIGIEGPDISYKADL